MSDVVAVAFTCMCGHRATVLVREGDKRGENCDRCNRLWDVSSDGSVVQSLLTNAWVNRRDVLDGPGRHYINDNK